MSHEARESVRRPRLGATRAVIFLAVAAVIAGGAALVARAGRQMNHVALAAVPKGVTVAAARRAEYLPSRRYVGTIRPWIEARIGPQLVSAYVDTVLVRPGDAVKRGQVIATLDCRDASASSRAVAMKARSIQAQQQALAHEAARLAELQQGGFASSNEIERRAADSASKQAELLETEARIQHAALEVNDCVLRAPFAGEIAERLVDPGAFVRPGLPVATIVDRKTIRVVADVPEGDFEAAAAGHVVDMRALATNRPLRAPITRRSPAADPSTRTVRIEIDVPDPELSLPVGTTVELSLQAGEPAPATEIPLVAAAVRGDKATVFVVEGVPPSQLARAGTYRVKGERGASLFVEPRLPAGAAVVTEGRGGLNDGDPVSARVETLAGPVASGPQLAGARP